LFDVYFWSDKFREGLELTIAVEENSASANEISDKISRARSQARKANIKINEVATSSVNSKAGIVK